MKESLKPETDERPQMIVCGILLLYVLIAGFIMYLFILHRLTFLTAFIAGVIFTAIYIPRFIIIKKLLQKDEIKITDDSIIINNRIIPFSAITDFRLTKSKPQVIFFINNKMIVFQQAQFHLLLSSSNDFAANEQISFTAIGSEKINLLTEFLTEIINKK